MASEIPFSTESTKDPILIDPRNRYDNLEINLPTPPTPFPPLQRNFPTQPDSGEKTYIGRGRLRGRRALITGGDSGIGRAVVIAMAREGAKVAINYLPAEKPDADDLEKLLKKEGIKIVRIPGDLLDEEFCGELVEKACRALGGLDVLVSNAGRGGPALIDDITKYTTKQWDNIFRTNVYASFFLTRAAVPHMPPGSTIIYTVSDVVANPVSGLHDYSASKGALASMVQSLGVSLASRGIRINGVAPGATYTPFWATVGATTEQLNALATTLPLGRVAQPAELAPTYVDLSDALGTYTSGTIVTVSGGAAGYALLGSIVGGEE